MQCRKPKYTWEIVYNNPHIPWDNNGLYDNRYKYNTVVCDKYMLVDINKRRADAYKILPYSPLVSNNLSKYIVYA